MILVEEPDNEESDCEVGDELGEVKETRPSVQLN